MHHYVFFSLPLPLESSFESFADKFMLVSGTWYLAFLASEESCPVKGYSAFCSIVTGGWLWLFGGCLSSGCCNKIP